MNAIKNNNNNQYNLTIADQAEIDAESGQNFYSELINFRRIHSGLLIVTLILVCFGLIMLFSASMSNSFATQNDNSQYYFKRQLIFSVIGLITGLAVANFTNINFYKKRIFYIGAYAFTTLLLLLVFLLGTNQMGAQRWLNIFGINFQPSEIAKFMAVYVLAGYFSELKIAIRQKKFRARNRRKQFLKDGRVFFLIPVLLMSVWFVLIAVQPHLSGALIFAAICFIIFIAAKIPWRAWLSGILQLLPILIVLMGILFLIFPLIMDGQSFSDFISQRFAHSAQRIETFNEEEDVTEDELYQTRQAEITMGTGGLSGLGLGKGRQKFNYLPQIHNDYIFPAIAEELGYFGTLSVLLLFFIQFVFGLKISLNASSLFSGLLAFGYSFLLIFQVILNVAVATKLIPATGITLPFFSYGGTSNIIFLVEVGMILCISKSGQRENRVIRRSMDLIKEGSH